MNKLAELEELSIYDLLLPAEIVEAAAKTEGDKSWKTLFREFLGETTFHGLNYIAHDAYFSIRRVIWLIITMGVAALFLYLVINQLVFLAGHPRAVNVEIIFADDVQYPAVTLCNQNYFRTCAILFGVLVVKRLVRMLLVRPRSVDVEIYYAGLLYPAVTICNQNYFR
ncbi:hypothetical protein CAPTEDRAFT_202284 [Capitella teleta]|uniref:Uncharacterized protein n=1 Tax=Capitella teleta TaxID=283909 RepID=R7VGQ9_CAPTE|nr:hypothetical protein CAPTEDRAFT_202284 [Capitella teleta]|eukprot:ELU17789.1 hypothetical protein CAPTEDRAFT_202284 [Capitella teleta]